MFGQCFWRKKRRFRPKWYFPNHTLKSVKVRAWQKRINEQQIKINQTRNCLYVEAVLVF